MRSKVLFLLLGPFILAQPAFADTFILPHLLEVSGRASLGREPGTTDVVIHVTDAEGFLSDFSPIGSYASVFFFTATGDFYPGAGGTPICAPCTFPMGTVHQLDMSLIEVMVAAGLSAPEPDDGYIVIETGGPTAASMDVTVETVLYLPDGSSTSSMMPLKVPCGGSSGGGMPSGARTFVMPHLLETSGSVLDTPNTFDTTIFCTYAATVAPSDPGYGASVSLYLFDEATGEILRDGTGADVCNPCIEDFQSAITPRKRKINIETLMNASGGGFPSPQVSMRALAVANGDVEGINMTASVSHARTGPGDLSVFVFEPNEIAAAAAVAVADVPISPLHLQNYPDPFNPLTTLSFRLDREEDVELRIVDVKGRVVRTLNSGRLPAGDHALVWDGRADDGSAQPAGVYLARLVAGSYTTVEKMALLK